MIIVMRTGSSQADIDAVMKRIDSYGLKSHLSQGVERTVVGIVGQAIPELKDEVARMTGVSEVVSISKPYKLATREFKEEDTTFNVGNVMLGGEDIVIMAGPCAVESEEQVLTTAHEVKAQGATILRGGAFKPRTSPYSFRGVGVQGLELLVKARAETGLPIVTEVVTPEDVELVSGYADMLQIGTRNSQNFNLLDAVGKVDRPVLLKRGFSSSYEEWLLAAEYILSGGNPRVALCERGIRTFEQFTRFTADISAIPVIKKISHLPIIFDPSHSTGIWYLVTPVSLAAVAAGAHGIIVDVHPDPSVAKCDGSQALTFDSFRDLTKQVRDVAAAVRKS